MKIIRLHVRGFGKIEGFSTNFSNGLNVVYGGNESGKSTLMAFIKAILYGVKGGRPGKKSTLPEGKRYMPWNGGQFGGYMNIELDDGSTYRIDRDFSTNEVKIYDGTFNDVTGNFVSVKDESGIAEKLIGLNQSLFEKTVFVRQMGTRIENTESMDLVDRISNIQQSGFEDISYVRAQTVLKEALKRQIGTDRSSTRPLDILNRRLEDLAIERQVCQNETIRVQEMKQRRQGLIADINILRTKDNIFSFMLEYCRLKESLKQQLKRGEEISFWSESIDQYRKNISELNRDKEALEGDVGGHQETWHKGLKPWYILLIASILVTAATGILPWFLKAFTPYFMGIPLVITVLLLLRIRSKSEAGKDRNANSESNLSGQNTSLEERIAENNLQYEKLAKRLDMLKAGFKQEDAAVIENEIDTVAENIISLRQKINTDLTETESILLRRLLEYGENIGWSEVSMVREGIKELIQKKEAQYAAVSEMTNSMDTEKDITVIDNEIERLTRQKKALQQKGEALNIAVETLEAASEQVRKKYIPVMNKVFNNTFSGLTSRKYTDIRAGENLSIMLNDPGAETLVPVGALSDGTVDQIYFSLRVAISETVLKSNETLPFIMDEPFAQYDDERTFNALRCINDISRKQQVIIFTCKQREAELISSLYPCKICSLTSGQ
jgi:DNA repair exonuclease SbcCD ATPase subunit